MIRISCVHTGAGAGIYGLLEAELQKRMPTPYVVSHVTNPNIIAEVSQAGKVTPGAAAALIRAYTLCMDSGADIILNVCSSVGEVADAAKGLFALSKVRIIRIDEAMCRAAAVSHRRIGVLATLRSTLEPSCELLRRCAGEAGRELEITELLAEGLFGLFGEKLEEALCRRVGEKAGQLDAVLLAQASMAASAEKICMDTGLPVYSSPEYAAGAVAAAARELAG